MSTSGAEAIPNIMPFGHAANALELPDGAVFVTWYCGAHEGGEDQRIAGTLRKANGSWQPAHIVVDRFEYEGDTWIPEIGVPVPDPDGGLRLFFWACPLSTFRLVKNPGIIRISGGWGGGSWFPYPTVEYEEPIWRREIPTSRVFVSPLGTDLIAEAPELFVEERGLVIMGAARKLRSGRWVLPYHTERKDCWFHSRFFVSDAEGKTWESRGDIFAEPGCLEPVVVQLPSGDILCYMRHGGFNGHVWRAVSADECTTWSGPERTNLRNPHAGVEVGWSRTSDRLLLVYNDSYAQRTPLCVGISDDQGKTFRMRDVESRGGAYAYPKLLQDRDGLWHLFYSHDYRHIQHAWFDEAWLEEGRQVIG
jgi:hypothetical protein